LGFKGSEDLGNGLKAIFQIETALTNDSSSTFGDAQDTFVGLEGGFGTVVAGRISTPLNNWMGDFDASGASNAFRSTNVNLTAFTGEANGLETRVDNAVAYVAPTFSGIQFAALYAPDEDDSISHDVYGIGLRYDAGPISAMYTWHAVNNLVDSHTVGGAYDFGVARLMATYILNDADASALEDETAWVSKMKPPGVSGFQRRSAPGWCRSASPRSRMSKVSTATISIGRWRTSIRCRSVRMPMRVISIRIPTTGARETPSVWASATRSDSRIHLWFGKAGASAPVFFACAPR